MPKLGYNPDKGYTEFRCDSCGKIVPWSTINAFGHCNECRGPEKDLGREPVEYQELSREIIREYGDNLLVKVTGLYLEQYRTTAFEHWTSRAAYDRRQKADGNQVFCMNLAETEETALADFESKRAEQVKHEDAYWAKKAEEGVNSGFLGPEETQRFLDRSKS